jgi:N-acyl-D-aspartate/D-glutamate deacylase
MEWRTYGEYLAKLEKTGVGLNVAPFVGHGTVRIAVMGFSRANPTAEEMERMKALVDQSRTGFSASQVGLITPLTSTLTPKKSLSSAGWRLNTRGSTPPTQEART